MALHNHVEWVPHYGVRKVWVNFVATAQADRSGTGIIRNDLIVRGCEDVGFAGIAFAFDSSDYPVSRTDDVTAFKRVNPSVDVHDMIAMFALGLPIAFWLAVVTNNLPLPSVGFDLCAGPRSEFSVFMSGFIRIEVIWVIAILEPLSCFDYYGFLSVFHFNPFTSVGRG